MIVSGLQLDIAWEEPAENLRRAEELATRAAAEGARLLVLPEMFATGFSMRAEAMHSAADTGNQLTGVPFDLGDDPALLAP